MDILDAILKNSTPHSEPIRKKRRVTLLFLISAIFIYSTLYWIQPNLIIKYTAAKLATLDSNSTGFYWPQVDELGNVFSWTKDNASLYLPHQEYKNPLIITFGLKSASFAGGKNVPVTVLINNVPVGQLLPDSTNHNFQALSIKAIPSELSSNSLLIELHTETFSLVNDTRDLGAMLSFITVDNTAAWTPLSNRIWLFWLLPILACSILFSHFLSKRYEIKVAGYLTIGFCITGAFLLLIALLLLIFRTGSISGLTRPVWITSSAYLFLLFAYFGLSLPFGTPHSKSLWEKLLSFLKQVNTKLARKGWYNRSLKLMSPSAEAKRLNYPLLQNPIIKQYHWLIALFLYTLITLAVTHPIIFHLNDWVLGSSSEGDSMQHIWGLWWFKRALETGQNPAYTDMLFGLLPSTQIFVWTYYNWVVGWVFQWFLSPLGAYNLLMALNFIFAGFTMYLLAGLFVESKRASFVAGFIYTFSSYHFFRTEGHLNLAAIQWLPFCAWSVIVFFRKPSLKTGLLAGIGIALVPLTDAYYLAYFLIPFGILFFAGMLIKNFSWFTTPRNLILSGVVGLVTLALLSHFLITYLIVDADVQSSTRYTAEISTEQISADLLAFIVPSYSNPFFGKTTQSIYKGMEFYNEKNIFLGYTTLVLGALCFAFRKNRNIKSLFWVALALVTFLLSLGPRLYIGGEPDVSLPFYSALYRLPLLSNFRAPVRLGLVTLLALLIPAAMALNAILRSSFSRSISGRIILNVLLLAILGFSLIEQAYVSLPYPSSQVKIPSLYYQMVQDKIDGLVLNLPDIPLRGSDLFFQTIHNRPLVGAYAPRISDRMITSMQNLPYTGSFYNIELAGTAAAQQGDIFPVESMLQGLQRNKVRYVVLHDDQSVKSEKMEWMKNFLNNNLGNPFYNNIEERLMAWQIKSNSSLDNSAFHYKLGDGWVGLLQAKKGVLEREVVQDGQLIISSPEVGLQTINISALALLKPLTMEIRLNGKLIQTIKMDTPGKVINITLESTNLNVGDNLLEFHSREGCSIPKELDPKNSDNKCYSFGIRQVQVTNPLPLSNTSWSPSGNVGQGF